MSRQVIAIGLDALDPTLLEGWVEEGKLPFLGRLFSEGTYARQRNFSLYRTENSWLTLLQGCAPDKSHEWGHQSYATGAYSTSESAVYGFKRYGPFYALGKERRVAVFDIPLVGLVNHVDGIQLLGWGTEVNQIQRQSAPAGLMADMIRRHGRHPLYDTITSADDGNETLSYRIPCLYDLGLMRQTRDKLIAATRQRGAILRDLMRSERWDLLFCAFGEIHSGGHLFWHLGRAHPLADYFAGPAGTDFLLEVMQAIDDELASLAAETGDAADLIIFSPHGMQANSLDLYSMLFLPELLYRWSSGQSAFDGIGAVGSTPPPPRLDYSRHWAAEVWDMRTAHGDAVLESPREQERRKDPLDWDPGNWYRPLWPAMRAFTLPGYSEGLVRINVAGRDGDGGLPAGQFEHCCNELTALLHGLRDARSGEPMIEEIIRVRDNPWDDRPELSPADLMVVWRNDLCTDVVDHPQLGRIGPAPFFRSGGHATEGFILAKGDGFVPGRHLPPVPTPDVTATLLARLGVPVPGHVDGRPLGSQDD